MSKTAMATGAPPLWRVFNDTEKSKYWQLAVDNDVDGNNSLYLYSSVAGSSFYVTTKDSVTNAEHTLSLDSLGVTTLPGAMSTLNAAMNLLSPNKHRWTLEARNTNEFPLANLLYLFSEGNANPETGAAFVVQTKDSVADGSTEYSYIFNPSGEFKVPALGDEYNYAPESVVPRSWIEANISGGGAVTWGVINGTLSDQEDLNNELLTLAKLDGSREFTDTVTFREGVTQNVVSISKGFGVFKRLGTAAIGLQDVQFTNPAMLWQDDDYVVMSFVTQLDTLPFAETHRVMSGQKGGSASLYYNNIQALDTRGDGVYDSVRNSRLATVEELPAEPVWGSITGTLADQLDLWAEMSSKATKLNPDFSGDVTLTDGLLRVHRTGAAAIIMHDLELPNNGVYFLVDQGSLRITQVGDTSGAPPYPAGNSWAEFDLNGAARLYYAGAVKVQTTAAGIVNGAGVAYALVTDIPAGGAAWGTITGTLSNQTDLQNALNAKAPTSTTVTLNSSQTITGEKIFSQDVRTSGVLVARRGSGAGALALGSASYPNNSIMMWTQSGAMRISQIGSIAGYPPYAPTNSWIEGDLNGGLRLYYNGALAAQTMPGNVLGNAAGVAYATTALLNNLRSELISLGVAVSAS